MQLNITVYQFQNKIISSNNQYIMQLLQNNMISEQKLMKGVIAISSLAQIRLSKQSTNGLCIVFNLILSLAVIILSFFLLKVQQNEIIFIQSYKVQNRCNSKISSNNSCTLNFTILNSINSTVYISYYIQDYKQNTKDYLLSKSYDQLSGKSITYQNAEKHCGKFSTNLQMGVNTSWKGYALAPNEVASPCGAHAKYLFSDRFRLFKNQKQIKIRMDNLTDTFNNEINSQKTQWIDVKNSKFVIWMKTSVSPTIVKLYGVLDNGLQKGKYEINIQNNSKYDGASTGIKIHTINNDFGQSKTLGQLCLFAGLLLLTLLICTILVSYKFK